MTTNTRSPIATPPSRRAGESLERKLQEDIFSWWFMIVGAAVGLSAAALFSWIANLTGLPRAHWYLTAFAAGVCLWAAYSIRGSLPQVRAIALGARGERSVSDILDDLRRERGYYVLHDIPIYKGGRRTPATPDEQPVTNIDHVLIGRAGVFALETKTHSKPESGPAKVRFDGRQILVNGRAPDRDPLQQARRSATDLERIIKQATGKDTPVRPVILFPGSSVVEPRAQPFWLLNPKRLFVWIRTEERRGQRYTLGETDAAKIATALRA